MTMIEVNNESHSNENKFISFHTNNRLPLRMTDERKTRVAVKQLENSKSIVMRKNETNFVLTPESIQ